MFVLCAVFLLYACGKKMRNLAVHVRYTYGSPPHHSTYLEKSQAIKKRPSRLREKDERKD
jgi:hypothetical protein